MMPLKLEREKGYNDGCRLQDNEIDKWFRKTE